MFEKKVKNMETDELEEAKLANGLVFLRLHINGDGLKHLDPYGEEAATSGYAHVLLEEREALYVCAAILTALMQKKTMEKISRRKGGVS